MSPPLEVGALDHLVLCVADTRRSVGWYHDLLGLEVLRFDEWEQKVAPFVSVRIDATTIIDLLETPPGTTTSVGNLDHLCLVVDPSTDLDAVATDGRFEVVEGPVERWGARGMGTSVYVRDPDQIMVELRTYPGSA